MALVQIFDLFFDLVTSYVSSADALVSQALSKVRVSIENKFHELKSNIKSLKWAGELCDGGFFARASYMIARI